MLIGLTGVQGTGKTTLVNELKKLDEFKNYDFETNFSLKVKEKNLPINEEGNELTQLYILLLHYINSTKKNVVMDRCSLDCLCYSYYLYKHNKINKETFNFIKYNCVNIVYKYDYIFYLEPEFPIENNNVRSVSYEFRNEMEKIFKKFISELSLPVIKLHGNINDRIKTIKEKIC